jgi:hypothetical protein
VLWDAPSGTTTAMGAGETIQATNQAGEVIVVVPAGDHFYAATAAASRVWMPYTPSGAAWTPTQLSSSGWVVGYAEGSGIPGSQFLYMEWLGIAGPTVVVWNARDGRLFDLTAEIVSAGGVGAIPLAVSDDGTVFGTMFMGTTHSTTGWEEPHPFAWDADHGLLDLTPAIEGNGAEILAVSTLGRGKVFYVEYNRSASYAWQRVDGIPQFTRLPVSLMPLGPPYDLAVILARKIHERAVHRRNPGGFSHRGGDQGRGALVGS